MTETEPTLAPLLLADLQQELGIEIDPHSGLPIRLRLGQGPATRSITFALRPTLRLDGEEEQTAARTLDYPGAREVAQFHILDTTPTLRIDGPTAIYTVLTRAAEWTVRWEYTLRPEHPRVAVRVELSPSEVISKGTLRDLWLDAEVSLPNPGSWRLEAPGNQLRPGIGANALHTPVHVSPAGGLMGSSGLVALHQPDRDLTFLWWPFSRTEIGNPAVQSVDGGMRLILPTGLAGRLSPGEWIRYGTLYLDLLDESWPAVLAELPRWYAGLGLTTPPDQPAWITSASIFEVQIGFSVFWGNYRYAPYPTVRDLLADLGRIRGLGYTALQIMPRQPYPSYNVHDYGDIDTSYGDEADLRALVASAHALGMRVILDILLHGVMDKEVMAQTAERVRSGPYADRLGEGGTSTFDERPEAHDTYLIAWARHVLDFEPYWGGGSPARHPLPDEHPEWFMRDSSGAIIGIYTKAFDVANPAWQEYFCQAAEELVRRLDVDGFRFDAPTYNDLPNWSPQTERRASYSPLGCLVLFDHLRPRLKRLKESVVLYTEPSGALFRQAMDITYNYDEQWLIPSLLSGDVGEQRARVGVRTGRDLAAWLRDRNAMLPPHSQIAHHIDSHDTFWWPLPGQKWRREQYGLEATRALLATFALSGGAYMTFVGGEQGIEAEVARTHRLRQMLPEIGGGAVDFTAVAVDEEAIYAVVRRATATCSVLLVNLSREERTAICSLDLDALPLPEGLYTIHDAWGEQSLAQEGGYGWSRADLGNLTVHFEPFEVRLLVLREIGGDAS